MPALMYTLHAQEYAKAISDNVFNAHLERHSMLALMPELKGKTVLDLGCGPGVYAEYFIKQGAKVTACDISEEMIGITKSKLGDELKAYVADLAQGLPEEADNSYDLVVCPLTIHYLNDLGLLFREVQRVLKKDGSFFFSTHHPMVDFEASPSGHYFQRELIIEEWDTVGKPVQVQFYRRPLTELFNVIASSGLFVARLNEGTPSEKMREMAPEHYERLSKNPNFIFLECKKLP